MLQNNWFAYLIQITIHTLSFSFLYFAEEMMNIRGCFWGWAELYLCCKITDLPIWSKLLSKYFIFSILFCLGDDEYQRLFLRMSLELSICCKITDLPIWSKAPLGRSFFFLGYWWEAVCRLSGYACYLGCFVKTCFTFIWEMMINSSDMS